MIQFSKFRFHKVLFKALRSFAYATDRKGFRDNILVLGVILSKLQTPYEFTGLGNKSCCH